MKTAFELGLASNYTIGTRTLLPDVPAILLRTVDGFKALSLICTHLGCTVNEAQEGFACPCHGSRYDSDGNVLRGPAKLALRPLRVEITTDGNLVIHTD